jgi:hypothetical protein
MVLGEGSIPTGSLYHLRISSSADYLYVAYASTESDTAISLNLYDGETWYEMPPVQNHWSSNIGTVDIAVHNEEPVVAFTENNLLTVKKFTNTSITSNENSMPVSRSLICYPNPAHSMITVQTHEAGDHEMKLSFVTGLVIHQQKFTGKMLQIDLSTCPKRIHFITVETAGISETRRIIKL